MNSHVFREYDIRGVVDQDFSKNFVENLDIENKFICHLNQTIERDVFYYKSLFFKNLFIILLKLLPLLKEQ